MQWHMQSQPSLNGYEPCAKDIDCRLTQVVFNARVDGGAGLYAAWKFSSISKQQARGHVGERLQQPIKNTYSHPKPCLASITLLDGGGKASSKAGAYHGSCEAHSKPCRAPFPPVASGLRRERRELGACTMQRPLPLLLLSNQMPFNAKPVQNNSPAFKCVSSKSYGRP